MKAVACSRNPKELSFNFTVHFSVFWLIVLVSRPATSTLTKLASEHNEGIYLRSRWRPKTELKRG